jgi:hypothetical protein
MEAVNSALSLLLQDSQDRELKNGCISCLQKERNIVTFQIRDVNRVFGESNINETEEGDNEVREGEYDEENVENHYLYDGEFGTDIEDIDNLDGDFNDGFGNNEDESLRQFDCY